MPRRTAAALLTTGLLTSLAIVAPTPASATVLVSQPASHVCRSHHFKVGVWYQDSGGSHKYRVRVYNPNHHKVLDRHGRAVNSHWTYWHIKASKVGTYRTKYTFANGKSYVAKTHSKAC